ncbi:MAG: hypothetical protein ACFFE5_08190 [Candidatus Thorarchaeota archaeon]
MKKEFLFIIGTFSLAISIILNMISVDIALLDFFEGVFTGISLVMNIGFLFRYRLEKNHVNDNLNRNKLEESSQNGYN